MMHGAFLGVNDALPCALVALTDGGDRADPLTRLLAKRLSGLRQSVGLNQSQLGDRMAELGTGWTRSTVVKLENRKRESVPVTDLFALALALGVPITALLVDPAAKRIPVAEGHEHHPVDVLLWLTAERPLPGTGRRLHLPGDLGVVEPRAWTEAAWPAWQARQLLLARDAALGARQRVIDVMDARSGDETAETVYTERLRELGRVLAAMVDEGMTVPPVDESLAADADRRGITLPAKREG
jgi:transcriptional regulator with XRE-family HTH domain